MIKRSLTWNTIWLKFSSSRSSGWISCNDFSFKRKIGLPFGKTNSNKISVFGSPNIGSSGGAVCWLISGKKKLKKKY